MIIFLLVHQISDFPVCFHIANEGSLSSVFAFSIKMGENIWKAWNLAKETMAVSCN